MPQTSTWCWIGLSVLLYCHPSPARGEDRPAIPAGEIQTHIDAALQSARDQGMVCFPIGTTRHGALIWCLAQPEAMDYRTPKQRRLIVGGTDGSGDSVALTLAAFAHLCGSDNPESVTACIPLPNPDDWAAAVTSEAVTDGAVSGFPPAGSAYNDSQTAERHVLWRFIGWFAPDVVTQVQGGAPANWESLHAGSIELEQAWSDGTLADVVRHRRVADIASTYAERLVAGSVATVGGLSRATPVPAAAVARALASPGPYRFGGPPIDPNDRSQLRRAIQERLERTPQQVAQQLLAHYGDHLKSVMYQPALALVARLRLGELTGDVAQQQDVERIVTPYLDGAQSTLPDKPTGSHLAGHLIFAERSRLAGDRADTDLVLKAADFGFQSDGFLRGAMPFHSEMSDAVFMACPILTAAARYSGDERYLTMADRHLQFMQRLCLREDDLYRHSPLCEAAWGRGNGFPALGLALSLENLDAMPESAEVLRVRQTMHDSLQCHLRALVPHQDVTGMWQQVVDDPGSYRELTSTCMITYAIVRGIRSGWLDAQEFGPVANRAWEAIKVRVGADGTLLDVCTGTGKQKSLQDYRDRTAILGLDERGGAMALMAAVEMAAWQVDQAANPGAGDTVAPAANSSNTSRP